MYAAEGGCVRVSRGGYSMPDLRDFEFVLVDGMISKVHGYAAGARVD